MAQRLTPEELQASKLRKREQAAAVQQRQRDRDGMARNDGEQLLNSDASLSDPQHDRLGYAPFAQHLADAISKLSPPEGMVVAIYGPWGAGKSTLLRFVQHYLAEKPEANRPIVVQFNPWWFSSQEDLTRSFFGQLYAVVSKWKSAAKDIAETLASLGDLVAGTGIPVAADLGETTKRLLRAEHTVPELKEKIASTLKKQRRGLLIIIDDVDRLTAEEIRQLFRLVKAVADFPNVVYLLSFDKEVVVRALEQAQGIPGEAYLEKIVQVPFELPLPDPTSMRELLIESLNVVLEDTPPGLFNESNFWEVFRSGIARFISTPRDIARFTNTLRITYPAVIGEVNPVDFLVIEAIRVFSPSLYDIIRRNDTMFTGIVRNVYGPKTEEFKPFHEAWLSQVPEQDREATRRLIIHVFPNLQSVWSNMSFSGESASRWRRELRVCSPDIFPTYFRLAVPHGNLSNAEMKAILALSSDVQAFSARLVELAEQPAADGKPRVRIFLDRLFDYTDIEIPKTDIEPIVQTLFSVGDELLLREPERRSFYETTLDLLCWLLPSSAGD